MEVFIISLFTYLLIYLIVYRLIQLFNMAYKKEEISASKFKVFVLASITTGFLIATSLPLLYQSIWNGLTG
ncbi:hypothetical protein [Halobacillus sp. Marseille-P3879]|uniref:hypothetical protein n=1 Tax=Halobacillus sp. Marseille-P3879 TaxID=2045014 RepID=UPI000C7DEB2D|nr:hypothetical protein [Halobacillus sp. Marseille-P3879]